MGARPGYAPVIMATKAEEVKEEVVYEDAEENEAPPPPPNYPPQGTSPPHPHDYPPQGTAPPHPHNYPPQPPEPTPEIKLQKEFKISGQINGKAGISYASLVRQVNNAVKKGYKEIDIVDGVVKAIPHTAVLRQYIDSCEDNTLASLRKLLRAHFAEKSATELYSELQSIVQKKNETACDYLMRAMDIRNKILFASKEDGATIKYDAELVNALFTRSVPTGLQDSEIRTEFSSVLKTKHEDSVLVFEIQTIVARVDERKMKFKAEVSVRSNELKPTVTTTDIELKELRTEVAALRQALSFATNQQHSVCSANVNAGNPPRRYSNRSMGCNDCKSKDIGRNCNHCWQCGSSEHFKNFHRRNNQGNGRGSQ